MTIQQGLIQTILTAYISHQLGARVGQIFVETYINQDSFDNHEKSDLRAIYTQLVQITNAQLFMDEEDIEFYVTELYNQIFETI